METSSPRLNIFISGSTLYLSSMSKWNNNNNNNGLWKKKNSGTNVFCECPSWCTCHPVTWFLQTSHTISHIPEHLLDTWQKGRKVHFFRRTLDCISGQRWVRLVTMVPKKWMTLKTDLFCLQFKVLKEMHHMVVTTARGGGGGTWI